MEHALETLNSAEIVFAAEHGLPTVLLHDLHALRQRRTQNLPTVWHQLAEWVVAPVLAGFAGWMASQEKNHDDAIFFGVMREGRLLTQLMHKLYGTSVKEVWINRNLAMLAAFGCGDDEALMNWLVRTRLQPMTKAQATEQLLGRSCDDGDALTILDAGVAQKLVADWCVSGFLDEARHRAALLADRIVRHWQKICDGHASRPVILMDFASVGNIQRSLQTVFAAKNIPYRIVGMNFSMTEGSRWAEEKGCVMRGFLADRGQPTWFSAACARTPELMEIFAASPLGSLHDYTVDGEPMCGASFLTDTQSVLITDLQQHILEAALFYQREMGAMSADLARCLWGRLLLQPTLPEAETLANWPLDAGLDGGARRVLASRLLAVPEPWSKMQTAWPAASRLMQSQ